MNVYQKLAFARLQFQQSNIKKSGKNTFAKYEYYELADILPVINKLATDIGFITEVSFTKDDAILIFRDTEKTDDCITFTSPMSDAELKGCHAVQNLGAVETYIKRYLYQNCFEIVEHDALDGTMNPNAGNPVAKEALAELTALMRKKDSTGKDIFTESEKTRFRTMVAGKQTEQALMDAKLLLEQKELAK